MVTRKQLGLFITGMFNKKLSCYRETARCVVSLNIAISHSRSFEMAIVTMECEYETLPKLSDSTIFNDLE